MSEYLTTADLAKLLHTTPAGIANLRHRGKAPAGARVGKRILYRRIDVERWFEANLANARDGGTAR